MSRAVLNISPRKTKSRACAARFCLLASVAVLLTTGCGPSEPQEISAATSGYKPSEAEAKANTKPVETPSANTVSEPPKESSPENKQLKEAPAVPSFQPGKLDPKIASKEYMTLALGDLNGPEALMEFLNTSSRVVFELLADGRRKLLTRDVLLDRGMSLSRMKLEAAERLEKIATTDDQKVAAAVGKLEAYSQMASFGDVAGSDSLRELSQKETANSDKRVAQLAKSISLSLLVADFESGTAKSEDVMTAARKILADTKDLAPANLNALAQAMDAISKRSEGEVAMQLAKETEEGFRDSNEPQLALGAWQLYARMIPETKEVESLIQSDSKEDQEPGVARKAADALMAKIPSPWTSFYLIKVATEIEYSGRIFVAKDLYDVAETQTGNLKHEKAKEELEINLKKFLSRVGTLNKPMNMSELVDLEGKPLDMARYKGKVVLVDFWATWCGPCLQEIPNIEEVYEEQNKNGFEVIGINLDEERSELNAFLGSKKLLWTTYVSSKPDAVGFQTPLVAEIGISAIPFIALIGKDGNVAEIHVRGRKIAAKVIELLAK
jgi:thiol-disulfide isomerase/thioredoxin